MPTQLAPWWKTKGKCSVCEKSFSKSGMQRHLQKCIAERPGPSRGKEGASPKLVDVLYLVVEAAGNPAYWMHLEMESKAVLGELDAFLRHIWLECCGHCSMFRDGETAYSQMPMDWYDSKSLDVPLSGAFQVGSTLDYEYDFGSTTALVIRAVSRRQREKPRDSIELLARNAAPKIPCNGCDGRAQEVCPYCAYDDDGWFCKTCMKKHRRKCEGGEMALPVVNSPRTGVCAYGV